jgi:hypothetical protein
VAAPPELRAPRPGPRRYAPPAEVRRYLTEIDALRIRRDYPTLAKRLTAVLAAGVGEPLRERLSVGLGGVLPRHGGDRDRACRHLAAHLSRYPTGRNRQEMIRFARQLGCAGYGPRAPGTR